MNSKDLPETQGNPCIKLMSFGNLDEEIDTDEMLRSLTLGNRFYGQWIARAEPTEIVAALRWLASQTGPDSAWYGVDQMKQLGRDIMARIQIRDDADFIRIYLESGEAPPDFVWRPEREKCQPPLSNRTRTSARYRRQSAKPPRHVQGFRHHLSVELALREGARKYSEGQREKSYAKPRQPDLVFAETVGARQLYSVAEAQELHQQAEMRFGRENKDYVDSVIRKLLKLGNRRELAKAPAQQAIDILREKFPNATDAIDHVDRAAALSRLTPDGYFQMPPILLLGDPGVGKTAFLQALSECLAVPFRRFDVGSLSMGGQLFGLSLGWSTGRAGDIFNMLCDSPVMNPVAFLDEVEKAGGNPNAPVVPGLLALLERETSKSFRDEAIDLAMNASHVVWTAAANYRHLMSQPLQSRFVQTRIERPEGEGAIRVASSIYGSLRNASPWGRLFPVELERGLACMLANYVPRQMAQMLTIAFGQAALDGRTYLKADDFPPQPKPKSRMGFL